MIDEYKYDRLMNRSTCWKLRKARLRLGSLVPRYKPQLNVTQPLIVWVKVWFHKLSIKMGPHSDQSGLELERLESD